MNSNNGTTAFAYQPHCSRIQNQETETTSLRQQNFQERKSIQIELELKYNEIYTSLEQIGKLVMNNSTPSSYQMELLYDKCNTIIETLLTEETYPAFIESLQQLQYSLRGQGFLWKAVNSKNIQINSESSTNSLYSDLQPFEGQSVENTTGNSSMRNINETYESQERCSAIARTKRSPSCKGLDDVVGLKEAKQLLQEALIMPTKYPQLFQGARQPWTRILLYGPPGTGKTRLAHAVAAEIDADFYCLSAADLVSSWVGESEKMIKELFSIRNKEEKPKKIIIFIDEIDSLCCKRSSSEAEHARRLKTELLIQMEETAKKGTFLLCATNCPWDVDSAFLRRFQRRIYIPTPNRETRLAILLLHSGLPQAPSGLPQAPAGEPQLSTEFDWSPVLDKTEGYSGSDLATLAQYALLQPVRELQHAQFWLYREDGMIIPCSPDHPYAMTCSLSDIPPQLIGVREIEINDFLIALSCSPSTVLKTDIALYENFTLQYGQMG